MNLWDIILIAGLAVCLFFAVRKCLRDRKNGRTCDGNCASCGGSCRK